MEDFSSSLLEKFKKRSQEIDTQLATSNAVVQINTIPEVPVKKEEIVIEERWTVYLFSVPVRFSKKIAWGFPSKEAARFFISEHLKPKSIVVDEIEYHISYDVIFESREAIDLYYNESIRTTVGNNKEDVLKRWLD